MSGLIKPTKNLCPYCFSTNVMCEVWINPNTNELLTFSDDSFQRGHCNDCKKQDEIHDFIDLIRVDKNKEGIDILYKKYIRENNEEPHYFQCLVMYTDNRNCDEHVTIKLSSDIDEKDGDTFYFCNGLDDLKSLCEKGIEDFIIIDIYCFE